MLKEFKDQEDIDPDENQNFRLPLLITLMTKIEKELKNFCKEAYCEAKYYLPLAETLESRLFYLKMMAD